MSWIKSIPYEEAKGKLKRIYDRIKGPHNYIDNILTVHGLRPHSLEGHMYLYKNVLHHADNTFPNWFLEALGTYVSFLNTCTYCYEHHYEGMKRFLNDPEKALQIRNAIENNNLNAYFNLKEMAVFNYAKTLTLTANKIKKQDLGNLREAGYDDGEILEINQVVSYFNYANRTVSGLGVNTDGDILGLSPQNKEDDKNWSHQ